MQHSEFDEKASTWDEDPSRVHRAVTIGQKIKDLIDFNRIDSVLEYGAGTGLLGLSLYDQINRLVLVDDSKEMVEVARQKIKDGDFNNAIAVRSDFLKDGIPSERFDLVMILMTLHHINDTQSILKAFNEILDEGGKLVIADLEKEDGSFHEGEFHGHHGFEKGELEQELLNAKFISVAWEVGYEVEKPTSEGKKVFPVFISVSEK